MNWKIIRRILLIFLIVSMFTAFFGYKFGLFNTFLKNYYADGISSATWNNVNQNQNSSKLVEDKKNEELQKIEKKSPDFNQSLVSIVQSQKQNAYEISFEEIQKMVQEAIELSGGFEETIKDNQTVVLKPNLVQMHVDSTGQLFDKELNGATTDWRVTRVVAQMVRKHNPHGKIYVMEGSAGDGTKKTMEYLNYTKEYMPEVDEFIAIEEDTGKWQDYQSPNLVKFSLPNGLLHKEYYLNKKYLECDVLISIPCLKTNSGTVVSGAIKNVSIGATPANIYGVSETNPGRTKMVSHKITDGELDKWLYDYYLCKPVKFVVIDGLQGFQNGPVPIGKKNITEDRMNMRLIIAGRDAVATDTVEALIMGWDPQPIAHLNYLSKSGMGIMDTSKIRVVGRQVDEVRKDFKIRFTNLGGVRITDREPPFLAVKKQKIVDNKINLTLDAGQDVNKIEVYRGEQLEQIITYPNINNIITIKSDYKNTVEEIKLVAYDRFLNHIEVYANSSENKSLEDGVEYFSKKTSLLKAGNLEGLIQMASEKVPSNPSQYSAYYQFPKEIIRLAHNKAMERFKANDNYSAAKYTEYGINEYSNVFFDKPLLQININDITIKSDDKYANMKIPANEFILIFNNYAYFVLLTGDNLEAEKLLRKVIELSPNRAVAFIDLGNACWNLGKKEEAKEHYKRYLKLLGKNTKNVPQVVYDRIKE